MNTSNNGVINMPKYTDQQRTYLQLFRDYKRKHTRKNKLSELARCTLADNIKTINNNDLFTRSEIAKALKVTANTVYNWNKLLEQSEPPQNGYEVLFDADADNSNTEPTQDKDTSLFDRILDRALTSSTEPKVVKHKEYKRCTVYLDPGLFNQLKTLKAFTQKDLSEMTGTALKKYVSQVRLELNI
jgi:DNA-binding transcriptional regulator YiaG